MKFLKVILITTLTLCVTVGGVGLSQIICKCFDCEETCCCEENDSCSQEATNSQEKNCCEETKKETPCSSEIKQISFDWDVRHIEFQSFMQMICLPFTVQANLFITKPFARESLFFADYSGPPLYSPREYLSLIQVLLI